MELSQVQFILFRTDLIELLGVVSWYVYFRPPLLLQFILHGTYNRLLSSLSLHYSHYFPSTFLLLVSSCLSSSTWHPTCTKRKLHSIYLKIKWKTTFRRLSFSRNQLMSFIVIFHHPHRTVCISSPILCPYINSLPKTYTTATRSSSVQWRRYFCTDKMSSYSGVQRQEDSQIYVPFFLLLLFLSTESESVQPSSDRYAILLCIPSDSAN